MMNTHRGQITFTNLLMLIFILIIYMAFIPIMTPMIEATVLNITGAAPLSPVTDMVSMLLRFIPLVILAAILLTALNYAKPQEQY